LGKAGGKGRSGRHLWKKAGVTIMKTLQDRVRFPYAFACRKHGLAGENGDCDAYADREIDAMSNSEFLKALSDAIEEWSEEK
jgi:hypothetical protein